VLAQNHVRSGAVVFVPVDLLRPIKPGERAVPRSDQEITIKLSC